MPNLLQQQTKLCFAPSKCLLGLKRNLALWPARKKKQFAREQLGIASRRGCLIRCRQKKRSSIGAQNQQNNESTFVYTDGGDEEDVSRLACSSEIYYCSAWSQNFRPKVVPLWIKKVERGKSCFSWVIDCSHHEQRAQRMHPIRALRPPLQRCPP